MATFSVEANIASEGKLLANPSAEAGATSQNRLVYTLGFWSVLLGSALNLLYIGVMIVVALSGFVLPPREPAQTIAGIITLLMAPVLVVMAASIHYHAPSGKKILSHLSLVFMLGLAVLTTINRYVQLTVVRQGIAAGKEQEVARFLPYSADSIMLSIEVLAWSLFLGLAVLFAAPLFSKGRLEQWIGWMLVITGILSLVYFFAFAAKLQLLSYSGVIAWSLTFPIAVFLMVPYFWRIKREASVD